MDCFNLQYRNKIKKYKGENEDAYLRRDCVETVHIPTCVLDKMPEEKRSKNPDKHHTYTLSNVTVQFTLCLRFNK